MVGTQAQQQSPGLVDAVKSNFSVDGIINSIVQSKDIIFEVGLYGLLGFAVGYLLKRYSNFVVTLALVIVVLVVLNQFQIVNILINWNKVYEYIGIQPALVSTDNLIAVGAEWARTNIIVVASAAIGFLIGLRAG
jgi:uncharacterized membrane protein (Fun14 family)